MSVYAGIILHPTSLPGPYGIGEIGEEAFRFVDWLESAGAQARPTNILSCWMWCQLRVSLPGRGSWASSMLGTTGLHAVMIICPLKMAFLLLADLYFD